MTDIDADEWPWLTMAQIHERWHVPRATLTKAIREGSLPARKLNSRWYVAGSDLRGWMESEWRPRQRE